MTLIGYVDIEATLFREDMAIANNNYFGKIYFCLFT